jgi:hypothetical protein
VNVEAEDSTRENAVEGNIDNAEGDNDNDVGLYMDGDGLKETNNTADANNEEEINNRKRCDSEHLGLKSGTSTIEVSLYIYR